MRHLIPATCLLLAIGCGTASAVDPVVSQIHNAPIWRANWAYAPATLTPFTRVNAGPGYSPVKGWVPGQPLAAYQLTSGACTSGTVAPSGIGDAIKDGTCTWKWVSVTDYISITGWSSDNRPWAAGTYVYHDVVTSDHPLRAYMQIGDICTSSIAPKGVGVSYSSDGDGMSLGVGADGCKWVKIADVIYSSRTSYIPTQTYTPTKSAIVHVATDHVAMLWNDVLYVAGQRGEKSPIEIRNHNSYFGEGPNLSCEFAAGCGRLQIRSAPGEGLAEGFKPSDAMTNLNRTKGATILMTGTYRWPIAPDGLYLENNVDVIGLQIRSMHGPAVGDIDGASSNGITIQNCILDGGSLDAWTMRAAVVVDTSSAVVNSLVISHSNAGIMFKYPGYSMHNTVVHVGPIRGDVGIITANRWVFRNTVVADTAIYGFNHAGAALANLTVTGFDPTSARNVTGAPIGDSGPTTWNGSPGATVVTIPGTTYGVAPGNAFVAGSYRAKPGGPLSGKGMAYGTFSLGCTENSPGCVGISHSADSPDLIGVPRPGAGGYDIGALQTP